jgi:hypothetical protein
VCIQGLTSMHARIMPRHGSLFHFVIFVDAQETLHHPSRMSEFNVTIFHLQQPPAFNVILQFQTIIVVYLKCKCQRAAVWLFFPKKDFSCHPCDYRKDEDNYANLWLRRRNDFSCAHITLSSRYNKLYLRRFPYIQAVS